MNSQEWLALSIRQPWLDLILRGIKTIEVRAKWKIDRRGPILLHASLTIDWPAVEFFGYKQPMALPRGGLVAYAEVGETFEFTRQSWLNTTEQHLVMRPLGQGTFGSVLQNVRRFENPIRCRGHLLLFPVPGSVLQKTRPELEKLNIPF
jgi:ASCH domain